MIWVWPWNQWEEAGSVTIHQESAVKIESMHYLDNPPKELSSLLAYPHVKAASWNIMSPPCHPLRLSNCCLVLVVWLLHREETGFQTQLSSACSCWKWTAVLQTDSWTATCQNYFELLKWTPCVLSVCGFVCLWVCYHDNSKLRASIFTKLGL